MGNPVSSCSKERYEGAFFCSVLPWLFSGHTRCFFFDVSAEIATLLRLEKSFYFCVLNRATAFLRCVLSGSDCCRFQAGK